MSISQQLSSFLPCLLRRQWLAWILQSIRLWSRQNRERFNSVFVEWEVIDVLKGKAVACARRPQLEAEEDINKRKMSIGQNDRIDLHRIHNSYGHLLNDRRKKNQNFQMVTFLFLANLQIFKTHRRGINFGVGAKFIPSSSHINHSIKVFWSWYSNRFRNSHGKSSTNLYSVLMKIKFSPDYYPTFRVHH